MKQVNAMSMLVDINSYKTLYDPSTINFYKCSVSCTTSDDPYAQTYALNKTEDSNVKVFNLMLVVNGARF